MRRAISFQLSAFSLILLFCLCVSQTEAAPSVTVGALLDESGKYDGKMVNYQAEAIGDVMPRGEYAWVNLRDETGAIGVFCLESLTEAITYFGDYKFKGDMVSVQGIFHSACVEHGGDTDIHAESLSIITQGVQLEHTIEPWKVKAAIALPIIAFLLAVIHLVARRFR